MLDADPKIARDLCARDLRDLSESVIHDFNYSVTDRNPNDRLMRWFSPGDGPQLVLTAAYHSHESAPRQAAVVATAPPPRHMSRTDGYKSAARSRHGQSLSDFHARN